jgi:hypothetical protein
MESLHAGRGHGLNQRRKPDKPSVGVFEQARVGFIYIVLEHLSALEKRTRLRLRFHIVVVRENDNRVRDFSSVPKSRGRSAMNAGKMPPEASPG